jgi:hypothetical protein
MSITVGNYTFEGPYTDTSKIQDRFGIYAIHCYREQNYCLIDVGESVKVKERIDEHERKACWKHNCSGILTFSVLYTPNLPQSGRMSIEKIIRTLYKPPCGQR